LKTHLMFTLSEYSRFGHAHSICGHETIRNARGRSRIASFKNRNLLNLDVDPLLRAIFANIHSASDLLQYLKRSSTYSSELITHVAFLCKSFRPTLLPFPRARRAEAESGECFTKVLEESFRVVHICVNFASSQRGDGFDLV
jgi:hypothetical protein